MESGREGREGKMEIITKRNCVCVLWEWGLGEDVGWPKSWFSLPTEAK